jgi:hypothetical protein
MTQRHVTTILRIAALTFGPDARVERIALSHHTLEIHTDQGGISR